MVRNYCAQGKIPDAFLTGKTWNIPEAAQKPSRINQKSDAPASLLEVLRIEKALKTSGGIYHKVQIELTYNSNHIEGSRLTHDQTRYIFETNTIGMESGTLNVDDVVETANHFKCIDMVIDNAGYVLSERFIKQLHAILKGGTSDSRKDWFAVGEYKRLPNEVRRSGYGTPEEVSAKCVSFWTITTAPKKSHWKTSLIFIIASNASHPFQDGNGRVGRLILFKECLRNNIVPFIIDEELKMFYYRGLHEWKQERGYLRDTCLAAQDKFKAYLDYFRVPYED